MRILLTIIALFCISAVTRADNLPDAPKPNAVGSAKAIRPAHSFYSRPAKIELATWGAVGGFDFAQTCHNIKTGGREDWTPTQSCGGLAALSVAAVGAEELIRYALHRHGHHRLERFVLPVAIAGNLAGIVTSKQKRAF